MRAIFIALATLALASPVLAQSDTAKKELVAKVLKIQQPGIDGAAQNLVEQPAAQLWQQTATVAQARVAPEQREALAKAVQADIKKYMDSALPIVRERATKLAPSTIGTLLEEKFSEEELKQLLVILESPVNRRFQQLVPDLQRALTEKLVAETGGEVRPKVQALQKAVTEKVNAAMKASAASAPGKAGKAASGAAPK